ncbi:phage tail sheath family protein [Corallococcus exercitus]|uniref:phage tail sheath family protein n=1 Tax=Corallococcus exercitus TaxID=2316736 RepID=UPI000EA18F47|nr:phage tail sheath C-terminal domain-containing protein [Corallococcus exercitus]RKG72381.1 phage tail sheath family protein [Corallococcus exercitus]
MANAYRHPGVYIEELPGPQQISGVGTSTTVFVGWTEGGTVNQPVLIDSWNAFTRTFGNFVWGHNVPFAVYNFFAEGGSLCYVVRAAANPPASMTFATSVQGSLTVRAAAPGVWGNKLAVLIENFPMENPPSATAKPTFVLRVLYAAPPTGTPPTILDALVARYVVSNQLPSVATSSQTFWVLEEFSGLTSADLAKPVVTAQSAIESRINSQSLFIRASVTDITGTRPPNVIIPAPLAGGAGDAKTTPTDYASALTSLNPLNDINLLVLPDTGMVDDYGTQRTLVQQALTYCESRTPRDLFLIADTPVGLTVEELVAFKSGTASSSGLVPAGNALNSSYGALYCPWMDFFNGLTSRSVPIPPSGAIAGTYAETDRRVGVFKAPAGVLDGKLASAVGLTTLFTTTDQDVLNPNGINAIRNLPRYGIVTYGARTLSTDPSLTYISVRRLLIYIEISLYWGMQWVVFEPNDQKLWGAVNRDVTQFLTSVWQAGGLFGAREAEAFLVQVDAGNNPPETRNQGQLFIDISVAPVRPAEFVIIRIQQATLPTG